MASAAAPSRASRRQKRWGRVIMTQYQADAHDGQKRRDDEIATPDPAPIPQHVEAGQLPVGEIEAEVKGDHGEDGDATRQIQTASKRPTEAVIGSPAGR